MRRTLNLLDPADRGERANFAVPIVPLPTRHVTRFAFDLDTHLTEGGGIALCGAKPAKGPGMTMKGGGALGAICMACRSAAARVNAEVR